MTEIFQVHVYIRQLLSKCKDHFFNSALKPHFTNISFNINNHNNNNNILNHNYIKILDSDWPSAGLISAVIGQLHTSCACNWTVVRVMPE